MKFIWPAMLLLLLLVPLFVYLYVRMQLRRRKLATSYGSLGMMQGAVRNRLGWRRHVPPAILLVALIILIVALARPQTTVSLPRIQGTVILAFDVSGSMAADDLKPTRMEAAKTAVQNFIERQSPSVRIGVVAFSESGLSVQVPTNDEVELLAAIGRLTPQRGTSLANGIIASLTTIENSNGAPTNYYSNATPTPAPTPTPMPRGTYSSSVIILLTDGENNQNPDPLEIAQAAADRGVRIYTVGIGSPSGADLHVEGFTIHTQLDEAMLQQISQITGGTYYNAENEEDLLNIYDNLNPTLIVKPEDMEVTSLLAGVSILILLIGGTISLLWFGRVP
ncbi:MAG: VWA domain-containing protein [Anaerolineaceae bacterium]|nr:VWA domain-containing protein [Anaerolineaceae bacterium]